MITNAELLRNPGHSRHLFRFVLITALGIAITACQLSSPNNIATKNDCEPTLSALPQTRSAEAPLVLSMGTRKIHPVSWDGSRFFYSEYSGKYVDIEVVVEKVLLLKISPSVAREDAKEYLNGTNAR